MYPQMIKEAQEEAVKGAERSFTYANEVEKLHADLYIKALEKLGKTPRPTIMYALYAATQSKARP